MRRRGVTEMGNKYLERLIGQREQLRADSRGILDAAAAEGRDVSDAEQESVEAMYREVESLDKRIEPLHTAELRQAQHDKQVAELQRATARRRDDGQAEPGGQLDRYRNKVGHYLADWGRKASDPAAAQRISRAHAEYRAVADQLLADNPGIVPQPIIGPVTGALPGLRPFIDSVTARPMPGGGSMFNRPKITQHSQVGQQAAEKTQLPSRKLTITPVPVSKKTFGGTLDISFQDRDWTDPAILAIAVSDLEAMYAEETDNSAADAFFAGVSGTFVLADGAAEGVIRAAFLTASGQVFANTKRRPDTAWMSTDDFAMYAAVTNASGGASFPGLADATGAGGTIMGLKAVVDANFPAKTTIIGNSGFVEHYETVGGLLSVTEPTILGYTIAYYGYTADLLVDTGAALKRSLT